MMYVAGKIAPDFRAYFQEHDIPYGQFAPSHLLEPDLPNAYAVNFSGEAELLASLRNLPDTVVVSSVITTGYENYVVPASIMARYFGVPGMTLDAARAATDKLLMRERFMGFNPAITPQFARVESWDDIEQFMAEHAFPLMLKPSNLMKSLHITKNESRTELQANYAELRRALAARGSRHMQGTPQIVIEEFMAGSMHTVAGFVDTAGRAALLHDIVDCQTAAEIGQHDMHLFSRNVPSVLAADKQQTLWQVAQMGVTALGLTSTPIHAEFILTREGPKIIEIGARMGGYRPRMFQTARGIDMYRAALDTAVGRPLDITAHHQDACSVIELFADGEGLLAAATHLQDVPNLASYQSLKLSVAEGEPTGRAAAGFRAPLTVILAHHDPAQIAQDRTWIQHNVHIEIDSN